MGLTREEADGIARMCKSLDALAQAGKEMREILNVEPRGEPSPTDICECGHKRVDHDHSPMPPHGCAWCEECAGFRPRKEQEEEGDAPRALGAALSQASARLLDAEIMREQGVAPRQEEPEAGDLVDIEERLGQQRFCVVTVRNGTLHLSDGSSTNAACCVLFNKRPDKPGDGFVHKVRKDWGLGVWYIKDDSIGVYFPSVDQYAFDRAAVERVGKRGIVVKGANVRVLADGDSYLEADDQAPTQTLAIVNTLRRIHFGAITIAGTNLVAGRRIEIILQRIGTDAADTFTGTLGIDLQVALVYTPIGTT